MEIIGKNYKVIRHLIDFFTSKWLDVALYKEIKEVTLKRNFNNTPKLKQIKFDYFTPDDFTWFLYDTGRLEREQLKIDVHHLDTIFEELAQLQILTKPSSIYGAEQIYSLNSSIPSDLINNDLIINLIMGWQFTVNRYSTSVLKIEHIADEVYSIGTGFLYKNQNLIVTNAHCVKGATQINIYDINENKYEVKDVQTSNKYDLAIIKLKKNIDSTPLISTDKTEILSEIVTIGYPSIPLTKSAYQVTHKGEINSIVEDYFEQDYIVFSAKTSSGNSGSPLINKAGQVIGVVASELFEKEALQEKGKLPYYAAIPIKHVSTLL